MHRRFTGEKKKVQLRIFSPFCYFEYLPVVTLNICRCAYLLFACLPGKSCIATAAFLYIPRPLLRLPSPASSWG